MSLGNGIFAAIYKIEFLSYLFIQDNAVFNLAEKICDALGDKVTAADRKNAIRAAEISKADLVTGMVTEFTELQGIMGREYAKLDGEPAEVAAAIDEQYMPRFAGDALPKTDAGRVLSLADNKTGLVLVTGAAGSGKSTTLACMIDRINRTREAHIITMEDPIEYIHRHDKSIVTQREISIDTPSYLDSLRSALRESPDVILLGEMRDYDTISAAITAAETGVLLFSTLHTSSAANTINRIVDVFPATQQVQVRGQLAQLIRGVVCQQLIPGVDGMKIAQAMCYKLGRWESRLERNQETP